MYLAEKQMGKKNNEILITLSENITANGFNYRAFETETVQLGDGQARLSTAEKAACALPVLYNGLLWTASVGLNYRKFKDGKMTESQYKRVVKRDSYKLGGGAAAGAGGAVTAGLVIGSFAGPIGTVLGAFAGGVIGRYTGKTYGDKMFKQIEEKREREAELQRQGEGKQLRYERALMLLGVSADQSETEIEAHYQVVRVKVSEGTEGFDIFP